jgi:lipopolysaccharide/colanic/teichoic acid biosynthesis glycosyltransferase
VLYRQVRVGYRGREFEMLKFRTMVPGADEMLPDLLDLNEHDGALFKIRNDPRTTQVGRFLRRHSLDEIPQVLNVIKGDMLLVGPRPCRPREMSKFGEAEHRRFLVKPGMTGLWQVRGRSDLAWQDAVKIDLYYVDNWSPVLDASILGRTLKVVVGGKGY